MRALDLVRALPCIAGVAAVMAKHLMETDAPVRWARRTAAVTAAAAATHAICDAEAALLVGGLGSFDPHLLPLCLGHHASTQSHL